MWNKTQILGSLAFVPYPMTSLHVRGPAQGHSRRAAGGARGGVGSTKPQPGNPVSLLARSGRVCGRACYPGVSLTSVHWGPVGGLKGRKFSVRKPVGSPTCLSQPR